MQAGLENTRMNSALGKGVKSINPLSMCKVVCSKVKGPEYKCWLPSLCRLSLLAQVPLRYLSLATLKLKSFQAKSTKSMKNQRASWSSWNQSWWRFLKTFLNSVINWTMTSKRRTVSFFPALIQFLLPDKKKFRMKALNQFLTKIQHCWGFMKNQ